MPESHGGRPRAILAVPPTSAPSNATEATPLLSGQRNPCGPPSQTQARVSDRSPGAAATTLPKQARPHSRRGSGVVATGAGRRGSSARSASAAASSTSGAQRLAAARTEAGARPADADHRDEGPGAVTDRSGERTTRPTSSSSTISAHPRRRDACDLSLDPRHVHDRLAREASGPHLGDPCSTLLLTELGQHELAGGRCVQGHVGAHPADDAEVVRCVQLGDDLHLGPAGGDREQRRLAGAVAKPAQRPAGRLDYGAPWIGQPGQPEQLVTDDPAVGRLGDEAAVEQRSECAADGGPRLAVTRDERRGRDRALGLARPRPARPSPGRARACAGCRSCRSLIW